MRRTIAAMAAAPKRMPSIAVFEGTPGGKLDAAEICAKGKSIFFGVPGAFTPGCSKTHLPGFVSAAASLRARHRLYFLLVGQRPVCDVGLGRGA